SHARSDADPGALALRLWPHHAARGPAARPHRRHGHPQGRELLSAADRDAAAAHGRARPRVPDRARLRRRRRPPDHRHRDGAGLRRRGGDAPAARGARSAQPHPGDPALPGGNDRAGPGQVGAGRGPASQDVSDLAALFAPSSIAVLGVSRNPAKLGYRLLQNVQESGYAGAIHPVNPSGEAILGCATVPSVEALPEGVDLALVSVPAPSVPETIKALAARGVRAAVILSSGFGEVDDDGRSTQAGLLASARAAGLRLVGPNCMGVYSAPVSLNGTYFWDLPRAAGGISIVSQSGAYGGLIFRHLGGRGLGVARFVSIGNQADVEIAEVLEWLVDDPATTVIACFVEALRDGPRFLAAARHAAGRKPIVMLKGGRSEAGRRAAGSHTGSLAGAWEVYRAACASARVVLAEETEEFFDAIETLVAIPEGRPRAPSVAVLTVSGGPSVVAADTAEREGLTVPALDEATRAALRAWLPPFAAVGNPVDLTPQVEPARIAAAVRRVFDEPAIAGVIAVNVGLDIPAFADGIVTAAVATGKPAAAFTADAPDITARFRAGGVPVLPSPERAVRAWRALWRARPAAVPV